MKRTAITSVLAAAGALALVVGAPTLAAQDMPADWDSLVKVKSKKVDELHLLPDISFTGYSKILIEPTEVAFRRNWQSDHRGPGQRVTDSQARRILEDARTGFEKIIREAFIAEGYEVVSEPGEDVLSVRPMIANLDIHAPDVSSTARTRSYAREAGEATLVVEARDSLSRQLLGRTVDRESAGEFGSYMRTQMTNRNDFERLFRDWAKTWAKGLKQLQEQAKIGPRDE